MQFRLYQCQLQFCNLKHIYNLLSIFNIIIQHFHTIENVKQGSELIVIGECTNVMMLVEISDLARPERCEPSGKQNKF